MADAWQSAWVEVVPDFKNFRSKANGEMTGILGEAGDSAGRDTSRRFTGSFLGGLGGLVAGIAAFGIGRLIGDAISTGIDQIQQSVTVASGLSESVNALNVSFGDAASGVQELGASAARSMGLSTLEFNNAAVRFSSFASTIAGKGGDVTSVIGDLTTRGADFASVFNLEVGDALSLFQSGLAGESEPLRQFGIDLSAASVNAFAYANGIAKTGEQLTAAEAVQARYGLLMQETSKAAGDFANTSGGLANQQRILAAEFENAQARLGTMLLPAITELMTVASTELMPILNDLIDEVGPVLADGLRKSVPAFKELLVAVAPLVPELVKLAVAAIPPLLEIIKLVIPLITDWAKSWTSMLNNTRAFFGFLAGNQTFEQFSAVLNTSQGTFATWASAVRTALTAVQSVAQQFAAGTLSVLSGFATGVGGFLSTSLSLITNFRGNSIAVLTAFQAGVRTVLTGALSVLNTFRTGAATALNGFQSAVSTYLTMSLSWITNFRGNALAVLNAFLAGARAVFSNVVSAVNAFAANVVAAFNRFVANVRSSVNTVISTVAVLPGRIRGFFAGAGNWLASAGRSLIQGFINGIRSMIGAVGNAIGGVLDYAAGFFPHSPAKRGPFSGAGWRAIGEAGGAISRQFAGGLTNVDVPLSASASVLRPTIASSISGSAGGGAGIVNNFTGPLTVTNEQALVAALEARQRRAYAVSGLGRLAVA